MHGKLGMLARTSIREKIKSDARHYARREGVPVDGKFLLRIVLLSPGFQFVLALRFQEFLYLIPVIGRPLRRVFWWMTCRSFGSEIGLAASIDGGLYIPHPYGIVVGVSTIGRDVTILQNVTIGRKGRSDPGGPRIEDGAWLAAGAVVLGDITIGQNSIVGANSVVMNSVPADSMAVGIPARVLPLAQPATLPSKVAAL